MLVCVGEYAGRVSVYRKCEGCEICRDRPVLLRCQIQKAIAIRTKVPRIAGTMYAAGFRVLFELDEGVSEDPVVWPVPVELAAVPDEPPLPEPGEAVETDDSAPASVRCGVSI